MLNKRVLESGDEVVPIHLQKWLQAELDQLWHFDCNVFANNYVSCSLMNPQHLRVKSNNPTSIYFTSDRVLLRCDVEPSLIDMNSR